MGFGVTSTAPCLAGVFGVCSFLFVTIWVAPENRARGWLDSRLYCFNAGFSGVPNGPYAHVFNRGSDFVHKPTVNNLVPNRVSWYCKFDPNISALSRQSKSN